MALAANALANDIRTAIEGFAGTNNTTPQVANLADAIATAVVNHIKVNGVVMGVCPSGGGPLAGGKVT